MIKNIIIFLFFSLAIGCSQNPSEYEDKSNSRATKGMSNSSNKFRYIVVSSTQSLERIAKNHQVSITELAKINNVPPYSMIKGGTKLKVPSVRVASKPAKPDTIVEENILDHGQDLKKNLAPQSLEQKLIAQGIANKDEFTTTISKTDAYNDEMFEKQILQESKNQRSTISKNSIPLGISIPYPLNNPLYIWPLEEGTITTKFGNSSEGIFIAAPKDTAVRAMTDGEVIYTGQVDEEYGKLIIIRHENNIMSAYAHNDVILIKKGDKIRKGSLIAKVGDTGKTLQPGLYFSIKHGNTTIDPEKSN